MFIALSSNEGFEFDRYMTSAVIFGERPRPARFVGTSVGGSLRSRPAPGGGRRALRVVAGILCRYHESRRRTNASRRGVLAGQQVSRSQSSRQRDRRLPRCLDNHRCHRRQGDGPARHRGLRREDRPLSEAVERQLVRRPVFEFLLYDTAKPGSFDSVTASLTFGAPLRLRHVGSYRVLIWSHPISVSVNGSTRLIVWV